VVIAAPGIGHQPTHRGVEDQKVLAESGHMTSTTDTNDQADPNNGEHLNRPKEPVTGTAGNGTGEDQAEENEQWDPVN
jgi:hypothetical protein